MNFSTLIDEVYEHHWLGMASEKPARSAAEVLKEIIKPSTNIKKITTEKIDKVIKELKSRDNKPATIQYKLSVLGTCLKFAKSRKWIDELPEIPTQRVENKRPYYFSEKEERKLLDYFKATDALMYAFCVIGFKTGMRSKNILKLSDDNFSDGCLTLWDTKNNVTFHAPLNDLVLEVLESVKPDYFKGLTYSKVEYPFRKAIKELGLNENYTIHTMRHTFCSRLAEKDTDTFIIQELAGHKNLTSTRRYTHLSKKNLREAVNRV